MTPLVPLSMLGWIPVVLVLFLFVGPRRAAIASLVGGWLLLPVVTFPLPGIPDYDKKTAAVVGVLLGMLLFDSVRLMSFRPKLIDLPAVVLCLACVPTAVTNDMGLYEGISFMLSNIVAWGFPYFIGRVYIDSPRAMKDLAVGILIGGMVYTPLCLWEIRMSPGLHADFYGYRPSEFGKGKRYGGYRPLVFLWTYLPVVHWMTVSTLAGVWLRIGGLRNFLGISLAFILLVMFTTLVLCKTMTAGILFPIGIGVPLVAILIRNPLPFIIVLLVIPGVMMARASGAWPAHEVVDIARSIDEERANSLALRISSENALAARALEQPAFGWGRYGRSLVRNAETGRNETRSDGLWVIMLGKQGLVGLAAFLAMFIFSMARFTMRCPVRTWRGANAASTAVAAVCLVTLVNNLPNSTYNPVVTACLGALAGCQWRSSRKRRTQSTQARSIAQRTAAEATPVGSGSP